MDSLGQPAANAGVVWKPPGFAGPIQGMTNSNGASSITLGAGAWTVYAFDPSFRVVAGASFTVSAHAPARDTQLVRLTLRTSSGAQGTTALYGRSEGEGTYVSHAEGWFAGATNGDGTWSLGGLPVGRWTLLMHHPNYVDRFVSVTVPAPGSTVTVPRTTLNTY